MRWIAIVALVLFVVPSGQVLRAAAGRPVRPSLIRRGSSSSGSSPERQSSGLLGDIVWHAAKKAGQPHSAQPHPAQDHSALPHSAEGHQLQGHPAQRISTSHHDIQTPGMVHLADSAILKMSRTDRAHARLDPELTKKRPRLGDIGASIRPPAQPEKKRIGRPRKSPGDLIRSYMEKDPKEPVKAAPPKKGKEQWWKQAGGAPIRPQGTSPSYDKHRNYRQRKKLKSLLKDPPDVGEHPPGPHHQGPHGRPPSPGAGSHAVSKRRLWHD